MPSPLAFILGREPHLSVAEIAAVLGDAAEWVEAMLSSEALVVPMGDVGEGFMPSRDRTGGNESRPYTHALMERLGGTVKLGEAWRSVPHDGFDGSDEAIGRYVIDHASVEGKVRFGCSVYDLGGGRAAVERIRRAIVRGAPAQKSWLVTHGRSVRWVTSREPTLSSVVVAKNKLLPPDGVEVLILVGRDHILLGRTLAVQPFEEWGKRDFGKPARSMARGMLPPKLARMMVNIAVARTTRRGILSSGPLTTELAWSEAGGRGSEGGRGASERAGRASVPEGGTRPQRGAENASTAGTILDPFCGTGTVLLEALALGYEVVGSDRDPVAIREARENCRWASGGGTENLGRDFLYHADVRELHAVVAPASVDAIVTEPYLGPVRESGTWHPRTNAGALVRGGRESRERTIVQELRALYIGAFREFAHVLKPGGRVVFVVPAFRSGRTERIVDITGDVASFGFRRANPFPEPLRDHSMLRDRADLPYARSEQRVGRRILVFAYHP